MESLRNIIKKNKTAVIGLVILAGLFIVYNSFIKEEDTGTDLVSEAQGIKSLELGREIIVTLNRLKTIQIDTGILEDPRFQKLQDFSEPLPKYSISKNNPFEIEIPGTVQIGSIEIITPSPAQEETTTSQEEVLPNNPNDDSVDASGIN